MSQKDDVMTSDEVCKVLGISRATLNRRVDSGEIVPLPTNPILKRPRRWLFPRKSIEALLKQSKS